MSQATSPISNDFRDAMANLAAAVSIVTSHGSAGTVGMTVSSVCSVSDSPASVLFCVNQQSGLHDIIQQNGRVCINVLNHQQQDLAKHFAGMLDSTMAERFAWAIWDTGWQAQPKLHGAIATLQGEIIASQTVGTHSIFIVQLAEIESRADNALIYFARQFKTAEI